VSKMPSLVRRNSTCVALVSDGCPSISSSTADNTASGPLSVPVSTAPTYRARTQPPASADLLAPAAGPIRHVEERSYYSSHLGRPHFTRTDCAVIGRSHGELGRFAAHGPARCMWLRPITAHSVQTKRGPREDATRMSRVSGDFPIQLAIN